MLKSLELASFTIGQPFGVMGRIAPSGEIKTGQMPARGLEVRQNAQSIIGKVS